MTKTLPTKAARKTRASDLDITKNPSFKAAMTAAGNVGARIARKADKVQRAADQAVAETIAQWLAWRGESDPKAVEEFFSEIALLATTGNRSRIMKHEMMPPAAVGVIEKELQSWKAAALAAAPAVADEDDFEVSEAKSGTAPVN